MDGRNVLNAEQWAQEADDLSILKNAVAAAAVPLTAVPRDNLDTNSNLDMLLSASEAEQIARSFSSSFPSFIKVMRRSSISSPYLLSIPLQFSAKYLPKCKVKVVLRNLKGDSWTVNSTPVLKSDGCHFSGGWRKFARDNNIGISDICIFQLLQKYKLQVRILRVKKEGLYQDDEAAQAGENSNSTTSNKISRGKAKKISKSAYSQSKNYAVEPEGSSGADMSDENAFAIQKIHYRKTKRKDESSDSEVTVPQRTRIRGQARRPLNNGRTMTTGRGMLDSTTFSSYFRHIWSSFPEEKVNSMAYFDPLWFALYANERRRDMNLTWIKRMKIFSKKYVLLPIVLWSHWSLLIFCHLGESLSSKTSTPCMLLLDSLHEIGPSRLETIVRRLLLDLYKVEERPEDKKQLMAIPLLTPKVPQQRNSTECGFYVLQYINLFLESAPENFSISKGYPYFLKQDWFTSEAMESFYKKSDAFPIGLSDQDSDYDSEIACIEKVDRPSFISR